MKKHSVKIELTGDDFAQVLTRLEGLIYIVKVMEGTISEKGILLQDTADNFKFKWEIAEDEA
jgi:hypothetical protein